MQEAYKIIIEGDGRGQSLDTSTRRRWKYLRTATGGLPTFFRDTGTNSLAQARAAELVDKRGV
jgi:hypothetical protein